MTPKTILASLLTMCAFTLTAAAADSTVTLSDVHICCGSCVKGVATAIAPITGASAVASQEAGTVVITAADKETVQKAVNALTAAGYFGKSSDPAYKVDDATNAPDGKVTTLEVSGVHLCCNSCVKAVNAVIAKVPGVTSNTVKGKATVFNLSGDFDAKAFFTELQKAGLTGKVAAAPK